MPVFRDQLGREVNLPALPRRIISVVPSQTELLSELGLENEVAGITKFCVHPESWFKNKTRVGGTKNLDIEKIRAIKPDLILANKEENTQEQIDQLSKESPVWVSDIKNLETALGMIVSVGELTGKTPDSEKIITKIRSGFDQMEKEKFAVKRSVYLIWKKPWMAAGNDTFIDDMMSRTGLRNVVESSRYPEIEISELIRLNPDVVLLSSEPYPFKEGDCRELENLLPGTKIMLVDGEMFSWYGSRMIQAPSYFRSLRNKM